MKPTIALLTLAAMTFAAPTQAADKAALLDFAKTLPMRTKLDDLKQKSQKAKLGTPEKRTFSWCNGAGCVDDRKDEVGSTVMNVYWRDGKGATLWVRLCRSWYAVPWQVIHVEVLQLGAALE